MLGNFIGARRVFWLIWDTYRLKKKYILGKKYFLPNIYFFSTDMCPKSTKKTCRAPMGNLFRLLLSPVTFYSKAVLHPDQVSTAHKTKIPTNEEVSC